MVGGNVLYDFEGVKIVMRCETNCVGALNEGCTYTIRKIIGDGATGHGSFMDQPDNCIASS